MTRVKWTAEPVEWVIEVAEDEVRAIFTTPESEAVVEVRLDFEQSQDLARALLRACSAVMRRHSVHLRDDSRGPRADP